MKHKTDLTDALADCLDALQRKELSLQECLDLFPQYEEELIILLGKFEAVRSLPVETARSEFRKKGHQELLNAIRTRPSETSVNRSIEWLRGFSANRQQKLRPVQVILAAVLALVMVTGGVAYASNGAAPGDRLYGLDRAMERLHLQMTPNVEDAIALRLKFAEERLKEVEDRIAANDMDDAQEAIGQYQFEIEGLAELVRSSEAIDDLEKAELIDAALNKNTEVLLRILEQVPEQAREAIQNVIEKNDTIRSNYKDHGKPDKPGKPDNPGIPEKTKKPEKTE